MSYQNLEVWQKAMDLSVSVYGHTKSFPRTELYNLTSQMRRSSVSVPSNIAEGKGRLSNREYKQFLLRARGSLLELETQVQLAARLDFLSVISAVSLLKLTAEVGRLLNGLIRFVERQIQRGRIWRIFKFLNPEPDTQHLTPDTHHPKP